MKLSFSTLACPGYGFGDICAMASDLGFDGIEVRGLGNDLSDGRNGTPFSESNIMSTAKKLSALGLAVSCFSSGACLAYKDRAAENGILIREYINAAAKIGCRFVRVLGDDVIDPGNDVDDEEVLAQLKALIPAAEEAGITLLVETNGVYSDTARLKALLETLNQPGQRWPEYDRRIHNPVDGAIEICADIVLVEAKPDDCRVPRGKPGLPR